MRNLDITLCNYLYNISSSEPDKKLYGSDGQWYTASEVYNGVCSIAAQLERTGLRAGDCVAIRMNRSAQTVIALLGLRMIGIVAILTDSYTDPHYSISQCNTSISVSGVLYQNSNNSFVLIRNNDTYNIFLNIASTSEKPYQVEENNTLPGYVIFTSGSTGKTKAVTLCDRNIIANLIDSESLGYYRDDDIALGILPLEHIFGLVLATGSIILGYSVYLSNHTDIPSVLQMISKEKITRMNGVPSLYLAMAEKSHTYDISTLRAGFVGGAPMNEAQFTYIENSLGMTLVPVYGMSECIGISCGDYRDSSSIRCSNVGRIYSMNTVYIINENGNAADVGEEGEICVNGPARMLGYWPDSMPKDEFMHTGDLGYIGNDGYLHITGRLKEIIIRNGKNISPTHIENVLLSLPSVHDVAVIGLPDEKCGEVPYAMIVGIVDPIEIRNLLPKNEMPAGFMCVDALPRTGSGKADKIKIREVLEKWRLG